MLVNEKSLKHAIVTWIPEGVAVILPHPADVATGLRGAGRKHLKMGKAHPPEGPARRTPRRGPAAKGRSGMTHPLDTSALSVRCLDEAVGESTDR